ncbi:hypothetical protein D3C80_1250290 [compost metagenome]
MAGTPAPAAGTAAEALRRGALHRRGQATAPSRQTGGRRLDHGVGDDRRLPAQFADAGLQRPGGPLGPRGLGAQDGAQGDLAGRQALDLGAAVALGALDGEQALAGQGGEAADADDLGLALDQGLGPRLKLRRHGADQDGGAHRVDCLVRRDQQGRRRFAAHHLQGRQQAALTGALAGKRGDQSRLAVAQFLETGALGFHLHIVRRLGPAQFGQLTIQIDDLVSGGGGFGAQATGARCLVAILGLKPGQFRTGRSRALARRRPRQQQRQPRRQKKKKPRPPAHQSR